MTQEEILVFLIFILMICYAYKAALYPWFQPMTKYFAIGMCSYLSMMPFFGMIGAPYILYWLFAGVFFTIIFFAMMLTDELFYN